MDSKNHSVFYFFAHKWHEWCHLCREMDVWPEKLNSPSLIYEAVKQDGTKKIVHERNAVRPKRSTEAGTEGVCGQRRKHRQSELGGNSLSAYKPLCVDCAKILKASGYFLAHIPPYLRAAKRRVPCFHCGKRREHDRNIDIHMPRRSVHGL